MIKRDKIINVPCIICKRSFQFFVNEKDYHYFKNSNNAEGAVRYFPYLTPEEQMLIDTGICENCE